MLFWIKKMTSPLVPESICYDDLIILAKVLDKHAQTTH